jgi:predicted nucleic acid-binding protein
VILVDTSVWVDFLRGADTPQARRLRAALTSREPLCTCGPIVMELLMGVSSPTEHRATQIELRKLVYLPLASRIYLRAAELFRKARQRGRIVRSSIDCMIAACAIDHDVPVLHRDRDYDTLAAVSDLHVVAV